MNVASDRSLQGGTAAGWRALALLSVYHFALGLALVLVQSRGDSLALQFVDPVLFSRSAWFFLIFSPVTLFLSAVRIPPFRWQVFVSLTADVVVLILLMHASGGIHSGFGLLLALSLAIGSLLTAGSTAYFFAAAATLGLIGEQTLAHLQGKAPMWDFIHAGMLGLALLTIAFLVDALTARTRVAELRLKAQALDLEDTSAINAHVLAHLDSGILVVDKQGRIRTHNDAAAELLRLPSISDGSPVQELLAPLAEILMRWRQEGMPEYSSYDLDVSNGREELSVRIKPLGEEPYRGAILLIESREKLRAEAHRMKLATLGQLAASIAHEIRNPLSAISQAAQLFEESPDATARDRRLTDMINRNTRRVNRVIENVLAISRRREPTKKPLDLCTFVRETAEQLSAEAPTSKAEYSVSCKAKPKVLADAGQLEQVLFALCENAVRYAAQGNQFLQIGITVSDDVNGTPCIEIVDNGPGISDDKRETLFEPFVGSGTGLGLYLARELVRGNGGELTLTDGPTSGARFRMKLLKYGDTRAEEGQKFGDTASTANT